MNADQQMGAVLARLDHIDKQLLETRADVKGVLAALAQRQGERAGLKMAAALYAFLVSLVTSLGTWIIATGKTTTGS